MNNLLSATARAMRTRAFTVRSTPVDYIPMEERRRIIEKLLQHVHNLADEFGVGVGRVPTLIINTDVTFNPAEALEGLANINFDILCAHHLIGTADVAEPALKQVIDPITPYPPFAEMIESLRNPPLPFTETPPQHLD